MSIEQLMKSRFKVVADYPNSPFRCGDILEIVADPVDKWYCYRTGRTYNVEVKSYPKVFQSIEWWQDRNPEEMPEYVWYDATGFSPKEKLIVLKVAKWVEEPDGEVWADANDPIGYCTYHMPRPATIEEYNQYKSTIS